MYDLGSRLKCIRLKRRLTQKELAAKINKSVSAVSSYESNAQLPPLDVLESIAITLNISIDYLAGLDSDRTYSTKNLNNEQVRLLDLIFAEFQDHHRAHQQLTESQIHILQKMICIFMGINQQSNTVENLYKKETQK